MAPRIPTSTSSFTIQRRTTLPTAASVPARQRPYQVETLVLCHEAPLFCSLCQLGFHPGSCSDAAWCCCAEPELMCKYTQLQHTTLAMRIEAAFVEALRKLTSRAS